MSKENLSDDQFRVLIKRRGVVKGKLTLFCNYIDNLSEYVSSEHLSELKIRISKTDKIYEEFDRIQTELELIDDDQYSERQKFEDLFYGSVGKATSLLKIKNDDNDCDLSNKTIINDVTCCGTGHGKSTIKLPVINLPKFSGSYENWLEFRDSFQSLINCNEELSDIQRFHYLRAALEGGAAQIIRSLEFSAKNYSIAWELLVKRYDNSRLLIHNHIKSLFEVTSIHKESSYAIRKLIDNVMKNLRSLETLEQPVQTWDTLLIYIITQKLDSTTIREWEEHRSTLDKLTFESFIKYLTDRADLLETLEMKHTKSKQNYNDQYKVKTFITQNSSYSCPLCHDNHLLFSCNQFKLLPLQERLEKVKSFKVCLNCLRPGHFKNKCRLGSCKLCNNKHNTLLHESGHRNKINHATQSINHSTPTHINHQEMSNSANNLTNNNTISMSCTSGGQVLLSTATIYIYDAVGQLHQARALLDSGSTSGFITESLCHKLKLYSKSIKTSVMGVNNAMSTSISITEVKIKSRFSEFTTEFKCLVLPCITQRLPQYRINTNHLDIPYDLKLADPYFHEPSPIDILIGADVFWNLISQGQIFLGKNKPVLQCSHLGWLISGPVIGNKHCNLSQQCNFVQNIDQLLTKFWEIEEVPFREPWTSEEKECEDHFIQNTTRLDNGRFCVKIPLKISPQYLGQSYLSACNRFFNLERKLQNSLTVKSMYINFINEYKQLNHLSEYNNKSEHSYFLPHHAVIREQSTTTKLRVVFDGSAKTSSGYSFNDLQMVGPTIQDDLFSILIRLRQFKYAICADIEKMYRQIVVHESDRPLQLIVWRDSVSQELKTYCLNTVTYGTSSAPFLSIRCLIQIGNECENPEISEIIKHDFYVDDFLCGADSLEKLNYIFKNVTCELNKGCFSLRKWKSNSPEFLKDIKNESIPTMLDIHHNLQSTVLGLSWDYGNDNFLFKVEHIALNKQYTKREVLSTISKLFDPIGLISPCIIVAKIILQKIWLQKMSWDDLLPTEINNEWLQFATSLQHITNVKIPRYVFASLQVIQLHCFSDASTVAYGACVYVRCENNDTIHVNLLCSKGKVAPIKSTTIPRLELCGALLAARLAEKVIKAFRNKTIQCFFWTDSTIVLGWLHTMPSKMKQFVTNRVSEILELTKYSKWNYISTKNNPSDIISRGADPTTLNNSSLWQHGPMFLSQPQCEWPVSKYSYSETSLPELRLSNLVVSNNGKSWFEFERFSSLLRINRVFSYVLRFIYNLRNRNNKRLGSLNVSELNSALLVLVRECQNDSFCDEIYKLTHNKQLEKRSTILSLNPFVDVQGILRVGGRLQNSEYSYEKKHPILLSSNHYFTKLLFTHEHIKLMHAGPQHLLASIREKFWPLKGRNLARQTVRRCVKCCRYQGKPVMPIMGNLPEQRLVSNFPFIVTGIDFAGPFLIASKKGRGCQLTKCYFCIFICFATTAVHLELVSGLSTDAFLQAFKRFISRRGKPTDIFCDNGTNFVGANKELQKFISQNYSSIQSDLTNIGIKFHFSPAYAPHFGGLFEAGVKSTKKHLKRVLDNRHLIFEEYCTLLTQVEAILNSRPLSPLSSDPNDLQPLTPGHFLVGRPLTAAPEASYEDVKPHRLSRYQHLEQIKQHFWRRWHLEYISELQSRVKWKQSSNSIQLGDLVIIQEDKLPPMVWKMARVVKLYPGKDGISRVADLQTSSGIIRRATNKLCILPVHKHQNL